MKILLKTLDSVVNQTLNNKQYEIIVIDDHSSDCTWDIVQHTEAENLNMYRLPKTVVDRHIQEIKELN